MPWCRTANNAMNACHFVTDTARAEEKARLQQMLRRYQSLLRYSLDERAVEILRQMIAETKERLRSLGGDDTSSEV
jgi:hypothetical protein